MNAVACASTGPERCTVDGRREAVRRSGHLAGIDYVEVYPDRVELCVHFFGAMPQSLGPDNVVIEGGASIRDIRVLHARFDRHDDGDTCLRVTVDRVGDFSPYCVCLVDAGAPATSDHMPAQHCSFDPAPPAPMTRAVPAGIDPRYACATFSFRIDCPSDRDCVDDDCGCADAPRFPAPAIDYLARDFTSFKRLMLDRMAATMPQWREQHLPDIGITLVELLAYIADQYSYTLDAVATEAHLGTALQRISVRRHARLLDYRLHEGCNARAWVVLESDQDLVGDDALPLAALRFATLPAAQPAAATGLVAWEPVQPGAVLFEAIDLQGKGSIEVRAAHREIAFHAWGQHGCCLPQGSTRATLRSPAQAPLHLAVGDILVLEEIRAADSGLAAGADPRKRHAVRLVRMEPATDPLDGTGLLQVEWDRRDALPFALCLSARTAAPGCQWVDVAVARGNVLLVDHGQTVDDSDDGWCVESGEPTGCCSCDGSVADMQAAALPLQLTLTRTGITHCITRLDPAAPASALLRQDLREALPAIRLDAGNDRHDWQPVPDLLSSTATDLHLVAEFDDDGLAQLRFGDGTSGRAPAVGECLRARYRVGNGLAGNVGAEAIVTMAVRGRTLNGVAMRVRNPLAAQGGTEREPVADARRFAPYAYGRGAERAVVASDYAQIAAADPRLDGAHAELAWTGSGYEAVVALDALALDAGDTTLQEQTRTALEAVRRIGHDLRCVPVHSVPLAIAIDVCVQPGYLSAEVAGAVAARLSARSPGGAPGLFHPDRLTFGTDVHASALVAAVQAIEGVAHLRVVQFARADADAAAAMRSFDDGVIAIGCDEIALLDNDANFPGRGTLRLTVEGGR